MTPYEYMSRARLAAQRIEPLTRELAALDDQLAAAQVWKTKADSVGHGKGTTSDPTAQTAEELLERLPRQMADVQADLTECKRIVGDCLAVLNDIGESVGRDAALALEIYWIDGAETWSEVAEELGTSLMLTCRMRDQAYRWMSHHNIN